MKGNKQFFTLARHFLNFFVVFPLFFSLTKRNKEIIIKTGNTAKILFFDVWNCSSQFFSFFFVRTCEASWFHWDLILLLLIDFMNIIDVLDEKKGEKEKKRKGRQEISLWFACSYRINDLKIPHWKWQRKTERDIWINSVTIMIEIKKTKK